MDPQTKHKLRTELSKNVKEFLNHGLTLQFMGGMTSERMFAAFEHAKALFHKEEYDSAMDILKFLCLQNHMHKSYFLYLGACYQKTNRHEMAVKAYTHAAVLDTADPRPHYNVAMCYLALNDLTGAEYAAADAQMRTDNELWKGDMQARVETLQRAINNRKHRAA